MTGHQLHSFDQQLGQYVLENIRDNMDKPEFAAYVEEQLDPPVLTYLHALRGDDEPLPLLLTDMNFYDLADTFDGGPIKFDRDWVAYEPLHRRAIDSVPEIRAVLSPECANEWVRASSRLAKQLESDRTDLGSGIRVVHDWVREARRLLNAMGATALLPRPEGAFPTPASPKPSPLEQGEKSVMTHEGQQSDRGVLAAIEKTQTLQVEIRDLLLSQKMVKEFYTTEEVAKMLGKAPFTVCEWCRKGRVRGQKQGSGRGKYQAWVISHEEMQRYQREGLLPATGR